MSGNTWFVSLINPTLSLQPTVVLTDACILKLPSNSSTPVILADAPLNLPIKISPTSKSSAPLTIILAVLTLTKSNLTSAKGLVFLLNFSFWTNVENPLVTTNVARFSNLVILPNPYIAVTPIPGFVVKPV